VVTYQLADGQVVGDSSVEMLIISKGPSRASRRLAATDEKIVDKPAWWAANRARYMALRKAMSGSKLATNDAVLLGALSMAG
jgi:hypothetical protein